MFYLVPLLQVEFFLCLRSKVALQTLALVYARLYSLYCSVVCAYAMCYDVGYDVIGREFHGIMVRILQESCGFVIVVTALHFLVF
jgi:hypothetical protein